MDQEGRNRAASTSSQSGSPPPKTASQGNFLLLPMLTKHYKTTLLLLLVWLIGYLGFSTTWILIGFFFYVVNEEYRKVKAAKRSFSQEAGQDEKAAILARVDELPAWVYFPDIERAEWLNKMIHQMWPYIGDYVKQLLKDTVQPIVDNALPGSLKPFKFEHIDLGDTPPRIGGVKVYSENVRRDEVIMDLEIFYAGDAEVKVAVRGMNAGIKHLTIHGIIRVVFKPLVPIVPLIGGMNVFFLNRPSVDFDLTNIANLLDTPVLSNTLRTVVEDLIAAYLVLPNKIPIQLVSSIDVNALKFPMPHGVLRLHIVAARDLLKADTTLMGKSSDPYTKLYLGNHTFKTNTIKNNINPVWNKFYEVAVDQKHGQVVELEVLDEDPGKDDELGTASIPIENVVNQGFIDSWLPLENVKTGLIHVRALWFHLSKDPEDLDRIGQSTDEGMRPSTEEHLSSALLIVNVDSAKSLPRGKKSMSEPSPYVNLGVGNTKEKSIVKPKTTDPRWEASFQFMVHNPRVQELYLEVVDSSKGDKKLGYINYPIKNLLTAKDLTVHRPFQLKDSSPNASVTLRMSLRIMVSKQPEQSPLKDALNRECRSVVGSIETIMTSEKPEEWALDHSDVPQTPSATSVASTPEENTTPEKRQPSPVKKATQEEVVRPQSQSVVGASRGTADLNENLDKNFTLGGDSSDGASLGSVNDGLRRRGTSLSSSLAPFGRIQLTVRYSSARNKLVLCIHQCINLIACDDDNLADPYVKVYLLPEKSSKKKTQVFKNNLNPVYDETFEWSLPQAELSGKMLHLTVKNSVGFLSRGQKEMGQLYIDVSNITASRTEWFDLLDPDTDKDSQTSL